MPKVRWTVKRHDVLGKTAYYSNSWFHVFVFQTGVGVWIFNELRSRSWCNGRRKGLGRPWPHSGFWNLILSRKVLAKNVVILVSSEKQEISPFLTPWKNSLLALPGKNACDAHGWCHFCQSGSRSQKMTPITLIRRQSRNYGELPRLSTDIAINIRSDHISCNSTCHAVLISHTMACTNWRPTSASRETLF